MGAGQVGLGGSNLALQPERQLQLPALSTSVLKTPRLQQGRASVYPIKKLIISVKHPNGGSFWFSEFSSYFRSPTFA